MPSTITARSEIDVPSSTDTFIVKKVFRTPIYAVQKVAKALRRKSQFFSPPAPSNITPAIIVRCADKSIIADRVIVKQLISKAPILKQAIKLNDNPNERPSSQSPDDLQAIHLPGYSSDVVRLFLKWCRPDSLEDYGCTFAAASSPIDDLETFIGALELADLYDMKLELARAEVQLANSISMKTNPLTVFLIAWRFRMEVCARDAAKASMGYIGKEKPELALEYEQQLVCPDAMDSLSRYWSTSIETAAEATVSFAEDPTTSTAILASTVFRGGMWKPRPRCCNWIAIHSDDGEEGTEIPLWYYEYMQELSELIEMEPHRAEAIAYQLFHSDYWERATKCKDCGDFAMGGFEQLLKVFLDELQERMDQVKLELRPDSE